MAMKTHPTELLFVYGTLMQGGVLNDVLKSDSIFRGYYRTDPLFGLVSVGLFPIAFNLTFEQGGTAIGGELYSVDKDLLAYTDLIEQGYIRKPVYVTPLYDTNNSFGVVKAYMYVYPYVLHVTVKQTKITKAKTKDGVNILLWEN